MPLFQEGQVLPNDVAKYTRNGVARNPGGVDGDNNGAGVNPFAVTDHGQLGFCSNSAKGGATAWSALCLGHDPSGAGILSLTNRGGGSATPLDVDPGSGMVVGTPTGGAKGPGTINAQGLFINGVAPGSGTTPPPAAVACANVLTYGAIADDATDTTAAFNAAKAAGPCVAFPAGRFFFAGPISHTMPNDDAALTMIGQGSGATKLRWATGNGLTVTYVKGRNALHVRGLSFLTDAQDNGVAVALVATFTEPSPLATPNTFDDVTFAGTGAYLGTKCWNTGVRSNYVSNVNWTHNNFSGCVIGADYTVGPYAGTGIDLTGGPDGGHTGIVYNVSASQFQGLTNGLRYGSHIQGVAINGGSNFVFTTSGISVVSGAVNTSQLTVTGSQFGYNRFGINDGVGVPGAIFNGNLVYSVVDNDIGFYGNSCLLCVINNNVFVGISKTGTLGVRIDNSFATIGGTIVGNMFYRIGGGIVLGPSTTRIRVGTNTFSEVDTNIAVSPTSGVNIITSPGTAGAENGVLLTVTGAVNNGSGLVRLTVADTTDLVSGQMVLVTSVGGVVAVSDSVITPIHVIDSTHIDLLTVGFSGAYTGGGRLSILP